MIAPIPRSLTHVLTELYPLERPQLAATTRQKMRAHIARWDELTSCCPADDVDRTKLLEFRKACVERGFQPPTINSYMRTVKSLVHVAGNPVSFKNLQLTESEGMQSTPRITDLDRVWRVTAKAEWPRSKQVNGRKIWCLIDPALWWRAVLILDFVTGLRRADLFGLTWDEIQDNRIPTINRKTRKPHYIPVPDVLQPWLNLLRRNNSATVLTAGDRCQQIDRELNRLARLVGMQELGLQAIRRASSRAYEKAHPGAGKLILNHGKSVTERYYLDIEEILSEAQTKLVYPPAFLEPPSLDRQLRFRF